MTESVEYAVIGLGALGSAAAYQLARRGHRVIGFEQFELGHERGASHDSSRILRRSYHTPGYVRLADEAYDDWARLSQTAGRPLVTTTGGVDLFPPDAAIPISDYLDSMAACDVPFELLDARHAAERWPQLRLPVGSQVVYQDDTGIVHAARTTALLQQLARDNGAELRDHCRARVVDEDSGGAVVETPDGVLRCRRLVVTADAWTNDVLDELDVRLPLTVTREQVTYFAPERPADFAPERFPVWIWMDDPSFYGFPTYGEPMVKAGQDVGGEITTADGRDFVPDPDNLARLSGFMARIFPGSGGAVRTKTCLYTLTPDRDFVLGALPGHESVLVGLGAGHGFKFTPAFGRILADLATDAGTTSDIAAFAPDRRALTDVDHPVSWLV